MTKYVWWIEDGEYSDYRVKAVYSTYKNAAKALSLYENEYSSPCIVRMPLDQYLNEQSQGYFPWRVSMVLNGNGARTDRINPEDVDIRGQVYTPHNSPKMFSTCLWAKDETNAIKIANERRTRFIAEGRDK